MRNIISNLLAKEECQAESDKLVQQLLAIKEIDGFSCQLKPIAGLAQGSEVASGQEAINLATRRSKSRAGKIGTFKAFDEYLDLPLPMVVNKPLLNAHGDKVIDTINVFANERYCELAGVNKGQLFGERYKDYFISDEGLDDDQPASLEGACCYWSVLPPRPAQLGQLLYQGLDHAKLRGHGLCPG